MQFHPRIGIVAEPEPEVEEESKKKSDKGIKTEIMILAKIKAKINLLPQSQKRQYGDGDC